MDRNREDQIIKDPLIITDRESGSGYYGGDQEWYSSNTRAFAGCGSVACANMLRILAHKYPEAFRRDYVKEELGRLTEDRCYKEDYLKFMHSIYDTMLVFEFPVVRRIYDMGKRGKKLLRVIPPSFGMSINGFVRGVLKYCRRRGLMLHSHVLPTAFCGYDKGLDFIREGLKKGGTVVMLTSLNRHPLKLYSGRSGELKNGYDSKRGVASHFMTITGIVEDEQGRSPLIKLSTWGRVATVSYEELNRSWHRPTAYTSCLYYFTPAESEATVRADIRNSYILPVEAVFKGLFGWLPGIGMLIKH